MWGGNATIIDILVRDSSVEKVKQKLEESKIRYEVIIEDLQKAIDEENPPIEESEDLDDRKGKRKKLEVFSQLIEILKAYLLNDRSLCSLKL